jgi:Asp/Glu/hydantoin racemase
MKIWIQSGTPLARSDLYKPYSDSLQRHARKVCRPDTVVDFPGLGKDYPGAGRSRTHFHFVQHETLKGALRAEAEGYDAFVTNCLDLGFNELRELVGIPVVFMTQSTLAFYGQLAPNFAFLVNSERLHHYFEEIADRYKLRERMVAGGYVSFKFTDYANLWNQPGPFIEQFMQAAGEITARGAASLCPAGLYLSQWLIDQGIREVNGAIVMDHLAAAIKTAETMVDLKRIGIQRYQAGPWALPDADVRKLLAGELGMEAP